MTGLTNQQIQHMTHLDLLQIDEQSSSVCLHLFLSHGQWECRDMAIMQYCLETISLKEGHSVNDWCVSSHDPQKLRTPKFKSRVDNTETKHE
jgi:hypothetical protein